MISQCDDNVVYYKSTANPSLKDIQVLQFGKQKRAWDHKLFLNFEQLENKKSTHLQMVPKHENSPHSGSMGAWMQRTSASRAWAESSLWQSHIFGIKKGKPNHLDSGHWSSVLLLLSEAWSDHTSHQTTWAQQVAELPTPGSLSACHMKMWGQEQLCHTLLAENSQ